MNPAVFVLRGAIRVYQLTLSSILGRQCRYLPTCSDYAREALAEHGALRGSWLAFRRLTRCGPWGGSGHDPVPPAAGRGCCDTHSAGRPH